MRSGLGVMGAIGVVTVVIAILIGIATATQGGDVVDPVVGIGILGLAAAGFAGVGLAVGGVVRSSLAAGVTGVLIVATLLLDTLGAALKLPRMGAGPVALPAPRAADGGHHRPGRGGRSPR